LLAHHPSQRLHFPRLQPVFGHALPNWDFEIAEKLRPGQYRYLQFAWRAGSPATRGITLRVDSNSYGHQVRCFAGESQAEDGTRPKKIADAPPREWQLVRVDLWEVLQSSVHIRGLDLASRGGPAAFDQILLGRTANDLPPVGH